MFPGMFGGVRACDNCGKMTPVGSAFCSECLQKPEHYKLIVDVEAIAVLVRARGRTDSAHGIFEYLKARGIVLMRKP